MRSARIRMHGIEAGVLEELEPNKIYKFRYHPEYQGSPISLSLPVLQGEFHFQSFPPFFEGLLPEGWQLEGLLRTLKIDRTDCFSQLIAVGLDLVGAVTAEEIL